MTITGPSVSTKSMEAIHSNDTLIIIHVLNPNNLDFQWQKSVPDSSEFHCVLQEIIRDELTSMIGEVRSPQAKNSRKMTIRAWYTLACPGR